MAIEFRCSNVAGFDATTQGYVKCNQLLRVSANFAGGLVQCPKCAQKVEVPAFSERKSKTTKSANPPSGASVSEFDRPDVMDMDFDRTPSRISKAFESVTVRCPKCGAKYSEDGICTLCGYAEPIQKTERQFAAKPAIKPAGFQLWLSQLSNDPSLAKYIGYGIFVASCLFFGVIIVAGILSTSVIGVALAVFAGFVLVLLFSMFNTTRQLARNPEAGLGLLKPFWNLLLQAARRNEWQKYESRLQNRRVIDRRKLPVSDSQLTQLEGLEKCEVLDLEGSSISDVSLRQLYGHNHLRCLVIRDTQTTRSGVARLQQAIPRLWIWH